MERFQPQSALTKSELQRRRQEEIKNAWGGMSLGDAIGSMPPRAAPSSLQTNSNEHTMPQRRETRGSISNTSDLDAQMELLNERIRVEQELLNNYEPVIESTPLVSSFGRYNRGFEEVKDPFREEQKQPETYEREQLNQVVDMRPNPTIRLPPGDINLAFFSQNMAQNRQNNRRRNNRANNRANPVPGFARSGLDPDELPLSGSMNGYNLDLLDIEEEDDYAYESLQQGKFGSLTP